jgi:hypothetical protein
MQSSNLGVLFCFEYLWLRSVADCAHVMMSIAVQNFYMPERPRNKDELLLGRIHVLVTWCLIRASKYDSK